MAGAAGWPRRAGHARAPPEADEKPRPSSRSKREEKSERGDSARTVRNHPRGLGVSADHLRSQHGSPAPPHTCERKSSWRQGR